MNWSVFFNICLILIAVGLHVQFTIRTNRVKRSLPFFPTSLVILVMFAIFTAISNIQNQTTGHSALWIGTLLSTLSNRQS